MPCPPPPPAFLYPLVVLDWSLALPLQRRSVVLGAPALYQALPRAVRAQRAALLRAESHRLQLA